VLESVAPGSSGEDDFRFFSSDEERIDDFVGGSFFENTVLVDAAAVGVCICADDCFVALDKHAGLRADEFGDGEEFFGFNCGFEAEFIFADVEGHDDFFEGGIAGTFTDSVDGDFDLAGAAHDAFERVGGGHSEIVVAVATEDGFVGVGHVADDVGEEFAVFIGSGVSGGVGDIDDGCAGGDHAFDDAVDVFTAGSTGVFHKVFDIIDILAGELDGGNTFFEGLILGHFELELQMVVADSESGVDSGAFGGLESFGGTLDVFCDSAGESADCDAFEFAGEGVDAFEITGG